VVEKQQGWLCAARRDEAGFIGELAVPL